MAFGRSLLLFPHDICRLHSWRWTYVSAGILISPVFASTALLPSLALLQLVIV